MKIINKCNIEKKVHYILMKNAILQPKISKL